jgi:hypothetical protein
MYCSNCDGDCERWCNDCRDNCDLCTCPIFKDLKSEDNPYHIPPPDPPGSIIDSSFSPPTEFIAVTYGQRHEYLDKIRNIFIAVNEEGWTDNERLAENIQTLCDAMTWILANMKENDE